MLDKLQDLLENFYRKNLPVRFFASLTFIFITWLLTIFTIVTGALLYLIFRQELIADIFVGLVAILTIIMVAGGWVVLSSNKVALIIWRLLQARLRRGRKNSWINM